MASLKKGEWSCYLGHFNGKENGHFTEVVTVMEGDGHVTEVVFNGGRMVMLQSWCLMEGA